MIVRLLALGGVASLNASDLNAGLDANLRRLEEDWGLEGQAAGKMPAARFYDLIRIACGKSGWRVVVLIDEYDRPLMQTMRRESADWCEARSKLVRPDFAQAIDTYWRRRIIE
jgi:hypothetical protein